LPTTVRTPSRAEHRGRARAGARPVSISRARGPYGDALDLQELVGNRAVRRLLGQAGPPSSPGAGFADPGRPLAPLLRAEMEQRFGVDFGDVRIHTGAAAERFVRGANADAVTVGNRIAFSPGILAPQASAGRRALAHELAHVVQQRRGGAPAAPLPHSTLEAGAERAAAATESGTGLVAVSGSAGVGLSRQVQGPITRSRDPNSLSTEELESEIRMLQEWLLSQTTSSDEARATEVYLRSLQQALAQRRLSSEQLQETPTAGTTPASPAKQEEGPGFWRTIGGALLGEFERDPTVPMILVDTGLGLIPIVDQGLDIRDVVAHLYWMVEKGEHNQFMRWLGLVFSLIGAIPEIGTAIKGVFKLVVKGIKSINVDELLSLGRRLIGERADDLGQLYRFLKGRWDEWVAWGTDHWNRLLDRATNLVRSLREGVSGLFSRISQWLNRKLQSVQEGLEIVRQRTPELLDRAFKRVIAMGDELFARLFGDVTGGQPRLAGATAGGSIPMQATPVPSRPMQMSSAGGGARGGGGGARGGGGGARGGGGGARDGGGQPSRPPKPSKETLEKYAARGYPETPEEFYARGGTPQTPKAKKPREQEPEQFGGAQEDIESLRRSREAMGEGPEVGAVHGGELPKREDEILGAPEPGQLTRGKFVHEYVEDIIDESRLPRGLKKEVEIEIPTGNIIVDALDRKKGKFYEIRPEGKAANEMRRELPARRALMDNWDPLGPGRKWEAEVVTYTLEEALEAVMKRHNLDRAAAVKLLEQYGFKFD
jgi:Domain of unknown function (DUF4157)